MIDLNILKEIDKSKEIESLFFTEVQKSPEHKSKINKENLNKYDRRVFETLLERNCKDKVKRRSRTSSTHMSKSLNNKYNASFTFAKGIGEWYIV